MYKKYIPDNNYSEWEEAYTVYRCKQDVECDNGVFEKDTFVMLRTCDAESAKVYVIDFASVCMRVRNNPFECDYINDIIGRTWDKAVIPVDSMHEYFEKSDEVNQNLKSTRKAEKKLSRLSFMIVIVFTLVMVIFLLLIDDTVTEVIAEICASAIACAILFIIIHETKKVHIRFCNAIISNSDMKKVNLMKESEE